MLMVTNLHVYVPMYMHTYIMQYQGVGKNMHFFDLIQVHCCVTMMNWQGIELIAQH